MQRTPNRNLFCKWLFVVVFVICSKMRMTDNQSGCVGCVIFTLISDPLVASPQSADSFS